LRRYDAILFGSVGAPGIINCIDLIAHH